MRFIRHHIPHPNLEAKKQLMRDKMNIKELIDAGLVKPYTDKAGNIIAYYMVDLDSEEFINSTIEEVHKEVKFENTVMDYNV